MSINHMEVTIQIFTLIGLGSGIVYLIGGCIVLLYLSRLGVGDYQILKVKYLVVGISFVIIVSLISLGTLAFSEFLLLTLNLLLPSDFVQTGVSIFFVLCWLGVVGYYIKIGTKYLNLNQYSLFTFLLLLLPLGLIFQKAMFDFVPSSIMLFVYITSGLYIVLRFVGVYSEMSKEPPPVKLAIEKDSFSSVKGLGLSITQNGITDTVFLIDESDKFYILSIGKLGDGKLLELRKDIIKAVIWE